VISDSIYICDFDHRIEDLGVPIRKQGIVKSPVVIESDVWIGTKATILRGARIEHGAVIGAHSVVKGMIPQFTVAVGVPARVVRSRTEDSERTRSIREHQEYIAAQVREAMYGLLRSAPDRITRRGTRQSDAVQLRSRVGSDSALWIWRIRLRCYG